MSNSTLEVINPVSVAKVCKACGGSDHHENGRCKPCTKAAKAKWVANNQSKLKAANLAYYEKNRERKKLSSAAWRADNPEKKVAVATAWYVANKGAYRVHRQNRRARKKASGGRLSQGLTKKLFKLQKGKCPCCKQPLGDDYHLDHKMPLALGGHNTDDNMQLLRAICNMQKGALNPVDFMQRRGFLL